MKTCKICCIEKPKTAFNRDKTRKDGLHPYCRECTQQMRKKNKKNWNTDKKGSLEEIEKFIREHLQYDPETGIVSYKDQWHGNVNIGKPVGHCGRTAYLRTEILGKQVQIHRIAWFLYHGQWPNGDIDHRNRIADDNRITNLRLATRSQNVCNRILPRKVNKYRGVVLHRAINRYQAHIKFNGKRKSLGYYDNPEAAAKAYNAAALKYHGEFAVLNELDGDNQ